MARLVCASRLEDDDPRSLVIPGIGGALGATEINSETPIPQFHDLRGNVICTAALSETETKLLSTYNSSEFGRIHHKQTTKYSWLGAGGVSSELSSCTLLTGTTSYVPQIGRSLQTEGVVPPAKMFPEGSYTGAAYTTGVSDEATLTGPREIGPHT